MNEYPQLAPSIEERMFQLQNDIAASKISLFDGAYNAYILSAELYDSKDSRLDAKHGLEEALNSDHVQEAYNAGIAGGRIFDFPAIYKASVEMINSTFGGNNIVDYPFFSDLAHNVPHWKSLNEDFTPTFNKEMLGVIYLDALAILAMKETKVIAENLLNPGKLPPYPRSEKSFYTERLKKTKFNEGYTEKVQPMLAIKSEEVFGPDAPTALGIARTLIFMNTRNLKESGYTLSKYRRPILDAVDSGDFATATRNLQELVLTQQRAFGKDERGYAGLTSQDIEAYNISKQQERDSKREELRLRELQKGNYRKGR